MKLLFIYVLFIISGCSYVTPDILDAPKNPIKNKIHSLIYSIDGNDSFSLDNIKSATVKTDFATIFGRALDNNICESSLNKYGYADLVIVFSSRRGDIWKNLLNFWTFFPGYLIPQLFFNYPTHWIIHHMQVEISIYNSKNKLIKKYIIEDKNSFPIRPWHIDKNYDHYRLSGISTIQNIMRKFEYQISKDA